MTETAVSTLDPSKVAPDEVDALLLTIAAEQARLAALQTALVARLKNRSFEAAPYEQGNDDCLDIREAAKLLRMSPSWLYRHAARLPFARRVGRRTLRFSAAGIRKY